MNTRGQYGSGRTSQGRTHVGAFLVHTLELKQRYNNVHTGAAQALLTDLTKEGHATLAGTNRWEIALKEGAWVLFTWYPDSSALEVTITDRELRPVDQLAPTRRRYEAILGRITPRLKSFGATTVGAAIVGQTPAPKHPAMVGITIYHSVGDRAEAVKQMAEDWTALYQDLALQVGEIARDATSPSGYRTASQLDYNAVNPDPKKVTWFKSYFMPRVRQWNKFKSEQLGTDLTVAADYIAFAERWQTNWSVYEDWKKRLDTLRNEAQRQGFAIGVPQAASLPTTVWADVADVVKRGAEKAAGGVEDVWKFAKYAAYGVLGIGAVIALSSVAQNLRSNKDPGEKYMKLIRERRPRAPRSLPGRAQLALPSGEGT